MKRNEIIINIKDRLSWLRSSQKAQMDAERSKAELVKKLIPAIKELKAYYGIGISFRWGGLCLDSDAPATHDKSWDVAERIYDQFVSSGVDVEVKKTFNPYRDGPSWDWQVVVKMNRDDRDSQTLRITVPNAEADLDCVPMKEVSTSSYWLCKKV